MTSATERLRELLDERGVEYGKNGCENVLRLDGRVYRVWAYDDERLVMSVAYITPEQAIAATLGAGECEWIYPQGVSGWVGYAECSACGYRVYERTIDEGEWAYCPNCGAKVVKR